MRSEFRSRGSQSAARSEEDIEGGNASISRSAKDGRRPKRRGGRKQSLIAGAFKKVARAKLRRYLRLIQRNPQQTWKLTIGMISMALLACLVLTILIYLKVERTQSSEQAYFKAATLSRPSEIIFNNVPTATKDKFWLPIAGIANRDEEQDLDYGGLFIDFFEEDAGVRQIYHNFTLEDCVYRFPDSSRDDDLDGYYNFDDDLERGAYIDPKKQCRRISEHRINFQNCNSFHEQNVLESGIKFLGEGAYRQVFALEHPFESEIEKVAIKDLHYENEPEEDNFEFVRMDAMVAERLSSSPRTFEIYGYCGLGILSEFFYHGDIEDTAIQGEGYDDKDLHDEEELKPQNDLDGDEKLILALEMAEGIAVMHGFSGGIIVHDDIQLSQFLLNEDKSMLKINDFNRAEFMLFDEASQQYCQYKNGPGGGNWRAPEEYKDDYLDEKIDVWSLGNNMYGLLTGLSPLYWLKDKKMQKALMEGQTAYIDPRYSTRSKEEARLAEIIEQCFRFNPDDRPSVFEVVAFLRNAVTECLGENVSRKEILKDL